MNSKYLALLKAMHIADFKANKPDFPEHAIPPPNYSLKDSNGLTKAVKALVNFKGGCLLRINSQGQWDAKLNRWRKSGSDPGAPDLIGTLPGGRSIGIEIKYGNDRQSDKQKQVEDRIKAAGGIYLVVRDFDEFYDWLMAYIYGFVTIYRNATTTKEPYYISVEKALHRIRDGHSQKQILAIRREKDSEQKAKLKKALPTVCFSGQFMQRSKAGLIQHSGFAILDFDKVGEPGILRESLASDPYIFAAWISPSGTGVKALVKIPRAKDDAEHKAFYCALVDHFPNANIDSSTNDVSRACYESWDPDLYYNPDSLLWTRRIEPKKYEPKHPVSNPVKDPAQVYRILKIWMDRNDQFVQGNMHNFYFKFACNLSEGGVPKSKAVEWLLRDYHPISEAKALEAIRNGYERTKGTFGTKKFKDLNSPDDGDDDQSTPPA